MSHAYPLLDQRIVEFAMALPASLYVKHGKKRYLSRQAMADTVPGFLLYRQKLPEIRRATRLFRERVKVLSDQEVLDLIAAADSPYVDTKALLAQCRRLSQCDTSLLKDGGAQVKAIVTAIHTLNIGKKA